MPTREPNELRSADEAIDALRGLPEEEKDRLRDEALRELHPPRRWLRVLFIVLGFILVFLALRARRDMTPDLPRGVETR